MRRPGADWRKAAVRAAQTGASRSPGGIDPGTHPKLREAYLHFFAVLHRSGAGMHRATGCCSPRSPFKIGPQDDAPLRAAKKYRRPVDLGRRFAAASGIPNPKAAGLVFCAGKTAASFRMDPIRQRPPVSRRFTARIFSKRSWRYGRRNRRNC